MFWIQECKFNLIFELVLTQQRRVNQTRAFSITFFVILTTQTALKTGNNIRSKTRVQTRPNPTQPNPTQPGKSAEMGTHQHLYSQSQVATLRKGFEYRCSKHDPHKEIFPSTYGGFGKQGKFPYYLEFIWGNINQCSDFIKRNFPPNSRAMAIC